MIKLLIVDDELLVCAGMRSMINWDDLNIEIIGTARNGKEAFDIIAAQRPEIVISDIKMPVMTGLELAEECTKHFGRIPLFIILTSYDEFELARRAIHVQVVDYLIKLELTSSILQKSIERALSTLAELKESKQQNTIKTELGGLQAVQENFFLKLYNNLFESEEQYKAKKEEANIEFSTKLYAAAICGIDGLKNDTISTDKLASICENTIQIAKETLQSNFLCYITALDCKHFCITLCLDQNNMEHQQFLKDTLTQLIDMVRKYLSISLCIAVGHVIENPYLLSESYT